jgi:hypothetical protein
MTTDRHTPEVTLSIKKRRPLLEEGWITHDSLGNGSVATELTRVYTVTDKHGIT